MNVLLSIRPHHVDNIRSGTKKFEYRRVLFQDRTVKTVHVYSTKPVGAIVGEFSINVLLREKLSELWSRTQSHSGISEEYFYDYFRGLEYGFAIGISEFRQYELGVRLDSLKRRLIPPQSFCYVESETVLSIRRHAVTKGMTLCAA